jgi:hypothetical protein
LTSSKTYLSNLIELCLETEEITKRIDLIYAINNLIPMGLQIKIPILVTNDYIDQEIYSLEEKLSVAPLSIYDDSFSNT